jgi:hypothetical protein
MAETIRMSQIDLLQTTNPAVIETLKAATGKKGLFAIVHPFFIRKPNRRNTEKLGLCHPANTVANLRKASKTLLNLHPKTMDEEIAVALANYGVVTQERIAKAIRSELPIVILLEQGANFERERKLIERMAKKRKTPILVEETYPNQGVLSRITQAKFLEIASKLGAKEIKVGGLYAATKYNPNEIVINDLCAGSFFKELEHTARRTRIKVRPILGFMYPRNSLANRITLNRIREGKIKIRARKKTAITKYRKV